MGRCVCETVHLTHWKLDDRDQSTEVKSPRILSSLTNVKWTITCISLLFLCPVSCFHSSSTAFTQSASNDVTKTWLLLLFFITQYMHPNVEFESKVKGKNQWWEVFVSMCTFKRERERECVQWYCNVFQNKITATMFTLNDLFYIKYRYVDRL